ncbi:Hypoxia up-regulated protein 1 [Hypsizygus marmoreus]|uniref:Hypoxia up-regulated protein 1 n=1 Tax=Hypsizygus marmoreus TaxID=39966 RepID=A0A369JXH4_HYPMA|nr:Hypoxia up-regulated protein 1 [Hypsizygus marmoreus]
MRLKNLCWSLLPILALVSQSASASVLAIDYGTDWIKASLMKPGVPFDVLLNKDSKRKIQSAVGWKQGDRLFGTDAANMASRFPNDVFTSLKYLQGAPHDSETVSYYTKISPSEVFETARKTVGLKQSDGTGWNVEELVAMQFAYIKHLAEAVAEEKVKDVVVTVPPFYSQYERDAIVDAIEIAGLRTLALVSDGTAVAVNYAMTRTFTTPEYHIIYDAGASSIVATVVAFTPIDAKSGSPGTHISVAGVGYERKTGGSELDRRMRQILIEMFNTKNRRDIREDKKGMAKLWKEAGRVKAILSANTEAMSSVESLAWDIDFRSKVTRAAFESACGDLKGKFTQPIYDALNEAGLSLDNITSVLLVGGASRTPMIQAAVKAAVGAEKIALNVNADEAPVLGAAFYGASLSRQFKTKNIKVSDISLHDIQASYFAAPTTAVSRPRSITTLIFPSGSKLGTKKTLTFKRKEDFSIFIDYKHLIAPGYPQRILESEITGIAEALGNLTERGAVDPVVKATLSLSDSGFISISEAVAYGEIKDDSIAGKLKGFFGGGSSSSEEATASSEQPAARETDSEAESSSSSAASASASSSSSSPSASPSADAATEKKKALSKEDTIKLKVANTFPVIPPMSVDEKKKARGRLRAIDIEEAAKNRKDEARNTFEGYLYRLRDLLDEENTETPFKKCSTESERKTITETLEDSFLWLHDKGDVAETSQFLDKRISLEALEKPIIHRYQEIEAFPQALNNSQMWNWSTRLFLTEARQNLTAEIAADLPSKWTKEELDGLEKTLKEHETWLNKWVEKQKSVKPNEDPVIETTEMKARAKVLETSLMKLWKRKVPKAKKVKVTSSAAEPEPTPTEGAQGGDSEAPPPPPAGDEIPLERQDGEQQPLKTHERDEL